MKTIKIYKGNRKLKEEVKQFNGFKIYVLVFCGNLRKYISRLFVLFCHYKSVDRYVNK